MCVVSMVGDHYNQKWRERWPTIPPYRTEPKVGPTFAELIGAQITRAEFEELRKEVLEMKELLKRAVEYDKRNNEPHCEMEDKVALLKLVAEVVGVDLKEVFNDG